MLQTIPNTDGIVILNDSWNRWTGFVTPSETFYLQFIYNTFANIKIYCFGNEVRFPEPPILLGFGKSASLHSRNKYQIGEGIDIVVSIYFQPSKQ
jgi:hypothetical protein